MLDVELLDFEAPTVLVLVALPSAPALPGLAQLHSANISVPLILSRPIIYLVLRGCEDHTRSDSLHCIGGGSQCRDGEVTRYAILEVDAFLLHSPRNDCK